jgi:hypothetical protein
MKTLKNVLEASILDIDANMKAGDDISTGVNQEFEKIKSAVSQHKLWEKRVTTYFLGNRTRYRLIFSIKNIAEAFHLKPNNLLLIDVVKNDESGNWEICLMLHSTNGSVHDYKSFRKDVSQKQVRNFPTLIKEYILPYFKDINTFIKVFNEKS